MQDGIELSSADVAIDVGPHKQADAGAKGKAKQVLQRQTTDEFLAQDTALDIDDVQDKAAQKQTPEERRKQFQGQGWSDVALQDK